MWGYLGLMLQYFPTFSHGRWDGWVWATQGWRTCTTPSPARHPASAMDVPQHLHKTFWVTLRDLGIAQGHKCCSAASAPSPGRAAERGSELHAAPELEAARGGEATASCEKSCQRLPLELSHPSWKRSLIPSGHLCTFHCIPCAQPHLADAGDAHSPGPPDPPPTFSLQLTLPLL